MAPASRRTCQVAGCSSGNNGTAYMTMESLHTQDQVIEDLKLHLMMAHPSSMETSSSRVIKTRQGQIDSLGLRFQSKLPTLTGSFYSQLGNLQKATQLSGQSACDQLWYCPSDSLKTKIFDAGIRPTNSESEILDGIKKLCMKAHNNMVNVMNFQNIYQ